ncbi:MAG: response regulator [Deltaproteobacteria bacterium]|nr:response regulator [Deltaproteobacteria bacterium]
MPVIAIFSGSYCNAESIVEAARGLLNYRLINDAGLVAAASKESGIAQEKISRAFKAKPSLFNKFTREREQALAYLRLATAKALDEDGLMIHGFCAHLIPAKISHVLRVCLIADMPSRLATARAGGIAENEAAKLIHMEDEDRAAWVHAHRSEKDPWASSLYDLVLPTDKETVEKTAALIAEHADRPVVQPNRLSLQAVADFHLAAQVEVAMVKEGHNVGVRAADGRVTLTINEHVLMLSRLENELKAIASRVPGVTAVETEVGPGFYQADVYRRFNFEAPSRILLVDDEREFVQTLSERLLLRDMGSAVAYDGETALELVDEDQPDVMILDLKMPGIDGIEVLRRVKQTQPEMEVIILTGHGSDADRKVCMELGAFDYLQKPVDIDKLSETIQRANEKIRKRQAEREA